MKAFLTPLVIVLGIIVLLLCEHPPHLVNGAGPMPPARSLPAESPAPAAPTRPVAAAPRVRLDTLIGIGRTLLAQTVPTQPPPDPVPTTAPAPPPPPAPKDPPASVLKRGTAVDTVDAPPTEPKIVVDCPSVGMVGQIVVVKAGQSSNTKLMQIELSPSVETYWNAAAKELVFSVREEGVWTLTITATSPDGGLAKSVRQITFGDPQAPAAVGASSRAVLPRPAVDFTKYVIALAKQQLRNENRKGDALAMAGAFRSAIGLLQTGGIRTRDELFRATDKLIEKALGNDLEACTPFLTELLKQTAEERGGLDRLQEVWFQIAAGLERSSQ